MTSTGNTKIFIASSHTAKALATQLANELTCTSTAFTLQPVRWWDQPPGSYMLDTLVRQTKECDFAAVLLTEADFDSRTSEVRDNCIYEAGLFTGALGGDPRRCFLVVSCDLSKVPGDLAGMTYIPIVQAGEDVDQKIKSAARMIHQRIDHFAAEDKLRALRGLPLPAVTLEALIWNEQPVEQGGVLRNSSINIFARANLRKQHLIRAYARRISTNLSHGMKYTFVTEASESNLVGIGRLVAMLAVSEGIDELGPRLREMHTGLEILFVEQRSIAIEYNIYNADDPYWAVCYVRSPDLGPEMEWIEWAHRALAIEIAQAATRLRTQEEERGRIFRSTIYHDMYGQTSDYKRFRARLLVEIRQQINEILGGELSNEQFYGIARACFGESFNDEVRQ